MESPVGCPRVKHNLPVELTAHSIGFSRSSRWSPVASSSPQHFAPETWRANAAQTVPALDSSSACDAHYRNWLKKVRISCANNSGSSKAAKWPPLGISSQRRIWYDRSPHSRGGRAISWGNRAMPAGAGTLSSLPITHRLRWFSKYIRVEELIVCVTQ